MKKVMMVLLLAAAVCGSFSTARAQHFDVEIDPIAYMLSGYSVHGGYLWNSFRFDVGVFGIEVPEAVHGNDGFTNRVDGFGVKLDYFLFKPQSGLFVSAESGVVRSRVEWRDTGEHASRVQYSVGARSGYRFLLGSHFTITPWIGLGYTLNAADQHVAGQTFSSSPFQPFPTVHVGYVF